MLSGSADTSVLSQPPVRAFFATQAFHPEQARFDGPCAGGQVGPISLVFFY